MNDKLIAIYASAMAFFTAEREDEKGATAVEYGLLLALIAAVIMGTVFILGDRLEGMFGEVSDQIENNTPGG